MKNNEVVYVYVWWGNINAGIKETIYVRENLYIDNPFLYKTSLKLVYNDGQNKWINRVTGLSN